MEIKHYLCRNFIGFSIMKHRNIRGFILSFSFLVSLCLPSGMMAQAVVETTIEATLDSIMGSGIAVDTAIMMPPKPTWDVLLREKLTEMTREPMFRTSTVGIMVWDLDADSAIFCHNEQQRLRPASTMKTVTAITAIDRLGGSFQFKTELYYTGSINGKVLNGDIYCVGGFDPRFGTDDMKAFVESVKKLGVDTIRGHIYADLSMKDGDMYGEGWCWDDDNPKLSPLLFNKQDIFLERFNKDLAVAGIKVEAQTGKGRCPSTAKKLCSRTHSIDQVLMQMLKESDKLYAEAMYYQLAASTGTRPSSAKNARTVINQLVKKLGLDPEMYSFADGSGLSLYNYVTPELEVKLLRYAYRNDQVMSHFRSALPIAGVDGTLKNRMKGTKAQGNVRAKTGTVRAVSALAGYCTAANGHRLCFSIINQGITSANIGRGFQDRVCTVLCSAVSE